MLSSADVVGFIPSRDLERSRPFYEGVLGLRVVSTDPFALVLDGNGTAVRVVCVQGVEGFRPQPFTILGWHVPDIGTAVEELRGRGVAFRRFPGMDQDDLGVWTSPAGARVAWFEDPDGNVLSLTEA